MTCEKTAETDWASWASNPRDEAYAEMRAHYPLCADCAREAARWTELRSLLAEEGAAHPSEEELLAHDRFPDRLAVARRAEVARHVDTCDRCRNELLVLGRLAPAPVGARADARDREGLIDRLRSLVEGLLPTPGRVAVVAATVMAVVIAFALTRSVDRPAELDVAETPPAVPAAPSKEPTQPPVHPEEDATRLADTPQPDAPARIDEPGVPETDEAALEVERIAAQPARPEPAPGVEPATSATDESEPSSLIAGPDIQLAAMIPAGPPGYSPGELRSMAELDPTRTEIVTRAAGVGASVQVLAPVHLAVSFEASPRLYVFISSPGDHPLELVVVDTETDDVALEALIDPPLTAGLFALDLAEHGVRLEPGSRYVVSAALLRSVTEGAPVAASSFEVEARPDEAPVVETEARRAHDLARAGSWVDAFATLSRWLEVDPALVRARAHRAALLEQVGLEQVDLD